MLKYLLLLLTMMTAATITKAQSFTIDGFDGKTKEIHLYVGDETLTFIYLKDTLHISNFNNLIGKIAISNKNFLKVVYRIRAGTGIDDQHTLLLCVDDKKLYQSLYLTSVFNEDFIDFSKKVNPSDPVAMKSRYRLFLNLDGSESEGFNLNIMMQKNQNYSLKKTIT